MSTTAILLIAHGSRHEPANADLRALAVELAGHGDYPIVEPAFLELADPDISAGGAACVERGAGRVLMVPYFLSAGVHLLRDLTTARDELTARHVGVEFLLGPPLGPHPLLGRLVLERVRELEAQGPPADVASAAEMRARYAPLAGNTLEKAARDGLAVGIDEEPFKG